MKHKKTDNTHNPVMVSSDIDKVRFHSRGRGAWYRATEVDLLLDRIKDTLEYYEERDNDERA